MKQLLICLCVVFAYADFKGYYEGLKDSKSVLEFKNPFFADDMNAQLHLQAIVAGKAKINEQWYQKDESVNGARIVAIAPRDGAVLLEKDTHQFHLTLKRANHKIHIH